MSLLKEQRILKILKENKNYEVIQITTTTENLQNRFNGNISHFFRSMKNGLYGLGGITNRQYFKELSGVYFTLEEAKNTEIIIVYDSTSNSLNEIQVVTRLRKLLGYDINVSVGRYVEYESRISDILKTKSRTQLFGDFYFKDKKQSKML